MLGAERDEETGSGRRYKMASFIICTIHIVYITTDSLHGYLKSVPDPLSEARHDMIDTLLKSNLLL
jgi:hypothetical protein